MRTLNAAALPPTRRHPLWDPVLFLTLLVLFAGALFAAGARAWSRT